MASPAASPNATTLDAAAVERGQSTAQTLCLACHSFDGSQVVGPSWKGIYGSTVELEDGTTVVVDDDYLHESIVNPMAKVVKGFPPSMVPYDTILSDEDIQDVIEFIKSLQ